MYVCMHACMYVRIVCMYVRICMYGMYLYACMYECIGAHVYL